MAKNMPVPNTRILNVPKTTGTQKFIITSKRCFGSFIYDAWARQRKTNDSREDHEKHQPDPDECDITVIDFTVLARGHIDALHPEKLSAASAILLMSCRILPLSSIQKIEWFDLYVFGFGLYVFHGLCELKICSGCDFLSQIKVIGTTKSLR